MKAFDEIEFFEEEFLKGLKERSKQFELAFYRQKNRDLLYEMNALTSDGIEDRLETVYRIGWGGDRFSVGALSSYEANPQDLITFYEQTHVSLSSDYSQAFQKPVPLSPSVSKPSSQVWDPFELGERFRDLFQKKLADHFDLAYFSIYQSDHSRQLLNDWTKEKREDQLVSGGFGGYLQSKHLPSPRSYRFGIRKPLHQHWDFEELSERWIQEAFYQLNVLPSSQVSTDRILLSPLALLQLLQAFGNFLDGGALQEKESLISEEELGKAFASPWFCLSDQVDHEQALHYSCDEEGVLRESLPLIENGVLKRLLHSKLSAHLFQSDFTGHGSLSLKPTSRPLFPRVCPALDAPRSSLSHYLDQGAIYIHSLSAFHAGCQPLQGSFSLPCMGWRQTTQGIQSLPQAVLVGQFRDLLNHIEGFSEEEEILSSGVSPALCVKDVLSVVASGN